MTVIYTTSDGRPFTAVDGTLLVLGDSNSLITDRTQSDVDRWRELHDKGWAAMTAAERSEWVGEMKGRYSYTDMNRVENAVVEIMEMCIEQGYLTTPLSVKTDWDVWDIPTVSDMQRYLGNIETLRSLVTVYPTTPKVPTVQDRLNYQRANDIEQILVDLADIFRRNPQSWYYAGEIYSGEV